MNRSLDWINGFHIQTVVYSNICWAYMFVYRVFIYVSVDFCYCNISKFVL